MYNFASPSQHIQAYEDPKILRFRAICKVEGDDHDTGSGVLLPHAKLHHGHHIAMQCVGSSGHM